MTATEQQVSTELDSEAVILSFRDGVYYSLNPVGARVWALLQAAPTTVRSLVDAVLEEFDVETERCESDLLTLLQELAEKGLIEIRNGPA